VSVAESLDTGSAAGRLVLNVMTAVSQWEREAIGERTKDALSHKRSRFEHVGDISFGYHLASDSIHFEPDATEQAVISTIRLLREKGRSLRQVAADLNQQGWRTRRGSPWRLEYLARVVASSQNVSKHF
jgi:site-specific DNA recombinase